MKSLNINKPKSIAKLKQPYKLNASLKKNSKLFIKKQKLGENPLYYKSSNSKQKQNADIFLVENNLPNENHKLNNDTRMSRIAYDDYILNNKDVYLNKRRFDKPDEQIDEFGESSSSNSSSSNNVPTQNSRHFAVDKNVHSSSNPQEKYSYYTKEYISVPTYSIAPSTVKSMCELSNINAYDQSKPSYINTSLNTISEVQIQQPCHKYSELKNNLNNVNDLYSDSNAFISSIDYLKEQEYMWKLEQLKKFNPQNVSSKANELRLNLHCPDSSYEKNFKFIKKPIAKSNNDHSTDSHGF